MKQFLNVPSSAETVKSLEVNIDTVYVRSNIQRIETEEFVGWQYDEIQYDIKEYMELLAQQEEVKQLENKLLTPTEIYERLDISSTPIEQLKHYKLNQLNEQCNKAIISGFTYEIDNITYLFSSSLEAQLNFTGTNVMFSDGTITEVYWSATNIENGIVERVKLDKVIFDIIKITMFSHVNSQIDKFRKILQPLVLNATTVEEVNSVVW